MRWTDIWDDCSKCVLPFRIKFFGQFPPAYVYCEWYFKIIFKCLMLLSSKNNNGKKYGDETKIFDTSYYVVHAEKYVCSCVVCICSSAAMSCMCVHTDEDVSSLVLCLFACVFLSAVSSLGHVPLRYLPQ